MTLTWTAPGALWLLAAVPLVWLGLRIARTNFNTRQRVLQAIVRSLLLASIALACARPVLSRSSADLSIVYAVDVSHSIAGQSIDDAAAAIDRMNAAIRPAHSRIVVFGEDVAVIDGTAALRRLRQLDTGTTSPSLVRREGTDLERALTEARAELAPGDVPRIVLFSDGRATSGDTVASLARLSREGVPVFVQPMATRNLGDSWVDRVEVPARVPPGALVTATVTIGSQRAAAGVIQLRDGATVLASQAAALAPGSTTVPIEVSFAQPGAHAIEASLVVPGDPLAINNRLTAEVIVASKPRVLYVEGTPDSAGYLRGALDQAGFDVTSGGPSLLTAQAGAFDPWDVVILSDLPRSALPDAAMTALGAWVEHQGGGLLVAGGESVFGEGSRGGYRRTEIERLTPVTFERKDEPAVALIIVLDKSWSMAGQQMDLCKTAAQAAIDVLADEQSVGVVTFNDELNWDVTLRNVGRNRDMIRKAVAAIEPSGHTLIYPAVEQAFFALKDARARAKHVVLLSDGRSYPDDYEGLVTKMVASKITVSSIAVGAAADVELLTNIAKWGKGRSYVVEDAKQVPQIFVKEAKDALTPAFDEKTIAPVLKSAAFLGAIDATHLPSLRGRTATVLKDGALELLATPDGDPLLAFWPVGLGRSAVFASDVKDRWASEWVKWKGYGPFFAAVVRTLARQRPPALALDVVPGVVRGGTRTIAVSVEARGEAGNYRDLLKPVVRVQSGGGAASELAAHQTAPGHYEASMVVNASDALTFTLVGADAGAARLVLPDPSAEYRLRPPDEAILRSIATATGGAWEPSVETLRNTAGARQAARRALWPALVVAALLLWLADLLARRIRVFEARSPGQA
jgi:Mg-chelatase subunit ChlD